MRHAFICFSLLAVFTAPAFAAEGDEQAIRKQLDAFAAAWGKHDAAALAAAMTEDATLVNPAGIVAKGRAEITKLIAQEHATAFKGTTYVLSDVTFQPVTADVIIADVTASVAGMKQADGTPVPDFAHRCTWVFVKKDGAWLGAAARPYKVIELPKAE